MDIQQLEVLGKVALAMLLGGVVGLERELARKPAGLRTLMLVAGAAALLVALGDAVLEHYVGTDTLPGAVGEDGSLIRSDPIRIIEAIITGVSFLGAGTIIVRRGRQEAVEGLTTAASILFVAGIGIAVSLLQLLVAVGAALLAVITLQGLGMLEKKFE